MPEDAKLNFLKMVGAESPPGDADDAGGPEEGLQVAADAAMAAVKAGDSKAFLESIRDIFDMMEARPHAEAAPEVA